jgi:hypothetical protein
VDMIINAAAAEQAGALVGRLILPAIGVLLIVLGRRRQAVAGRAPEPRSAGKGLRIAGWIVLVLGVLGALAAGVGSTTP